MRIGVALAGELQSEVESTVPASSGVAVRFNSAWPFFISRSRVSTGCPSFTASTYTVPCCLVENELLARTAWIRRSASPDMSESTAASVATNIVGGESEPSVHSLLSPFSLLTDGAGSLEQRWPLLERSYALLAANR